MIDVGTIGERACASCAGIVPHTYERRVTDSGSGATGAAWRSCLFGWICPQCGTLTETVQGLEDHDPITGEWQPRVRRSVRVPIAGQPLHISVRADAGHSWAPAGVNLSMSGILVEFPPRVAPPELRCGADLKVALRFEKHLVIVDGEVKRREGPQYGIAFAPAVDEGASFKPDPLRVLVGALEQRWLAARAR